MLPKDISCFSLVHDGPCYRKTNYSSAAAEEFEQEKSSVALLLHDSGMPPGEDTASIASTVIADNNTRGPNRFMTKQKEIVGADADDYLATDHPDLNHVIKNCSNKLYATAAKDKSFNGRLALSSVQIRLICSDITKAIKRYNPNIGNPVARTKCLDQLAAVIRHRCGDHRFCKDAELCTYTRLKNKNPNFSQNELDEAYAANSKQNNGRYTDLSTDGIEILEKITTKCFNGKIINKIAECGCSNACEGFFGQLMKFTEGKCLQGNGTNFWQSVLELCFCNNNCKDTEWTKVELSVILNLPVTPVETISHSTVATKRKKDYARHSLPLAKER